MNSISTLLLIAFVVFGGAEVVTTQTPESSDSVAQYVGQGSVYSPTYYKEPNYGPQPYDATNPGNNYLVPYSVQQNEENPSSPFMANLIPYSSMALRLVSKLSIVLLGGAMAVILGGVLTAGLCSFTPLCSVTFNGLGSNLGTVATESVARYMTPDNINAASSFVRMAIDKYHKLQTQ